MRARPSGSRRAAARARPRIVSSELVRGRLDDIRDAVARRAYDIFERRGRADGHHEEDWRQAEAELLFPLAVTVADVGACLAVEAAVPGFDACDVEVCVEPRRVTITGQCRPGDAAGAAYRKWMYRAVELPEDVATGDVTATIEDGVVALTLRKVAASEAKPVD
jgi:HSP20 family molecular chaperone IbpA